MLQGLRLGRTSDTVFRREMDSRRQWGYGTCYSFHTAKEYIKSCAHCWLLQSGPTHLGNCYRCAAVLQTAHQVADHHTSIPVILQMYRSRSLCLCPFSFVCVGGWGWGLGWGGGQRKKTRNVRTAFRTYF